MTADSPTSSPRVLVLQVGARLHYGVPAVYARHGALEALYTDATASKGPLRIANELIPERLRGPTLRRLLGRVLPAEIPAARVKVETISTLLERAVARFRVDHDAVNSTHARLRRRLQRDGFGGANCLYAVDNSDLSLLQEAKQAGVTVLYEQIINPSVGRIMREERTLFPGIEPQDAQALVEDGIAKDIEIFRLADSVVCASDFVRDDIQLLSGDRATVDVIPYGLEESWLKAESTPVPGRVLFVGTVGLRKGSHYLAEATRLLRSRGVKCEVDVVGPGHPAHPAFAGPRYLGQIPRADVRRHFASADVFVLPTLSESFGLVHLEALAHGVPVITTPHCGSVVRDGVEGFIVDIRSSSQLADRIEQVITDRALRTRLSHAARVRAAGFTWARYGEGLMEATVAARARRAAAPG